MGRAPAGGRIGLRWVGCVGVGRIGGYRIPIPHTRYQYTTYYTTRVNYLLSDRRVPAGARAGLVNERLVCGACTGLGGAVDG